MIAVDFLCSQDNGGVFALVLDNATPVIDNSLQTLVLVSLFTDRRIMPGDALPSFFDATQAYQGGFWGDDYPSDGSTPGVQAQPHGSLLWTLDNAKQIQETADLASLYIDDALAWMVVVGFATAVDATAAWVADGYLQAQLSITQPNGAVWKNNFLVNQS